MVTDIWRWFSRRQFLSTLLIIGAVTVPGYCRQGTAIDDAHDAADDAHDAAEQAKTTADQLVVLLAEIEAERADRRAELCERDVQDQLNDRVMWLAAFEKFSQATEVLELGAVLDQQLPVLVCDEDDVPVPG